MTAEERRALLGDAVIQHIHDEVRAAPPPPPEVLDKLRPILTRAMRQTATPPRRAAAPAA